MMFIHWYKNEIVYSKYLQLTSNHKFLHNIWFASYYHDYE